MKHPHPGPGRPSLNPTPLRWQRRASPLARASWLVYALLIVDASLYPFSGWRERGAGAFDYLFAPWPGHALEFDMVVNVLGYLPFGLLGVFALYPRLRGPAAAAVVTVLAAGGSALLEATQTFLPTRVASKVDLVTNVGGALLGTLLGWTFAEAVLDRGRLMEARMRWFDRDASAAVVITTLWFGAILYPQPFAFACGNLVPMFAPDWVGVGPFERFNDATAVTYAMTESVVAGAFLCAAGLLLVSFTRSIAPRVRLVLAFVAGSAICKTFGTGFTYAPDNPFLWVSRGAFEACILAAVFLLVALHCPPRWRRPCAVVLLVAGLVLSNLIPPNPYYQAVTEDWVHGRLLNFYGLALGLNLAWPFVALAYLCRPQVRTPGRLSSSV